MQLNTIQPKTQRKYSRQVGRGGRRGKTSGRGTKGQKARAGRKMRPELRDIIKKIPKRRGYGKNRAIATFPRLRPATINVDRLNVFSDGAVVTPAAIFEAGLVSGPRTRARSIKILGNGALEKKLVVENCTVSKQAREKIEQKGGTVK